MVSLFFFTIFTYQKYPQALNPILHALGKHSYFAYLVHPFVITYLALALQHAGRIMTGAIAIAFYCWPSCSARLANTCPLSTN